MSSLNIKRAAGGLLAFSDNRSAQLGALGAAVGGYIAGPPGAQIGYALGSATGGSLENSKRRFEGPRAGELQITGAEYGQPIPWVLGSPRIAGQIWWASARREIATDTRQGKGGGPTTTTFTYEIDLLVGLCEGPIAGVGRVWVNGELVYNMRPDADAQTRDNSCTTEKWRRLTRYKGGADQVPDAVYEAAVGAADAPGYRGRACVFIEGLQLGTSGQLPNLTFEIHPDCECATAGASAEVLPPPEVAGIVVSYEDGQVHETGGVADVITGGVDMSGMRVTVVTSSGSETVIWGPWSVNASVGAAEGANWTLRHFGDTFTDPWVFQASVPVYSVAIYAAAGNCVFDTVFGSENSPNSAFGQEVFIDGSLFGVSGVHCRYSSKVNVNGQFYGDLYASLAISFWPFLPAFRQLFIFADTDKAAAASDVTPIGGGCSNAEPSIALQDAILAIADRVGIQSTLIDVEGLATFTKPLRSLAIAQPTPARAILEQLQAGWFFDVAVSDKLRFRPRAAAAVATIPHADLAAGLEEADPQPLPLQIGSDIELPPQVAVTYINAAADGAVGTEWSDRLISGQGSTNTVQLGIGMLPAEAKGIADAIVADSVAGLTTATIALPPKYARLEPADVIDVQDEDARTYRLRITRREDVAGLLRLDCVLDDPSVITSAAVTDTTYTAQSVVTRRAGTTLQVLDIPLLRDADDGPGYYVAAQGDGTGTWPGAVVLSSANDVDFSTVAEVAESAVFGTCTTTLGTWAGGHVMDERNTLGVTMGAGELESVTREALLADEAVNVLLVGSEIIRFATATLTGTNPNTYTLSRLLRGQRGTEWAVAGHVASERAVLLRPRGLRRVITQASEVGQARYIKGVTAGASPADVDSAVFTNANVSQRPLAPVNVRGSKDAFTGTATITWDRRTRYSTGFTGAAGISVPLGEQAESYVVRIYSDAGFTTLKRTLSASTASVAYTLAQQVADLGSGSATFYVRVQQVSVAGGEGYATDATMALGASVGGTTALSPVLFAASASGWLAHTTAYSSSGISGIVDDLRTTSFWKASAAGGPYVLTRSVTTATSAPSSAPAFQPVLGRIAQTSTHVLGFTLGGSTPQWLRALLDLSADPAAVTPSIAFTAPRALAGEASRVLLFGDTNKVHSSTDGVTWSLLGTMAGATFPHDVGDGTYLTHGVQKIGSRWFLGFGLGGGLGANANRLFYSDDADAVTGWTAASGITVGSTESLHEEVVFDGTNHYAAVTNFATGSTTVYASSDGGATWASEYVASGGTGFEATTSGTDAPFAMHLQVTGTTGSDYVRLYAINGVVFEKLVGTTSWSAKASGLVNPSMGFSHAGASAFYDLGAVFTAQGSQVRFETSGVCAPASGF